MPFGSLGVRPQPVVEQQIPNYAQWDWDMGGKAQKAMESTHKMTQDAQNQPLLRQKQSLENELESALFPTKLTEMTAKIEQMKADTNYRNAMAQKALGEVSTSNNIASGGRYADFISKKLSLQNLGMPSGYTPMDSDEKASLFKNNTGG
jgi:hypothetical protein